MGYPLKTASRVAAKAGAVFLASALVIGVLVPGLSAAQSTPENINDSLVLTKPSYASMANPKDMSSLEVLTCGSGMDVAEFELMIETCDGMKRSYFSYLTTLNHLKQGCAFHTLTPRGTEYVVKKVFSRPNTTDGRLRFADRSRLGVLREDGTVSPRSSSPVKIYRTVPDDCPAIRY